MVVMYMWNVDVGISPPYLDITAQEILSTIQHRCLEIDIWCFTAKLILQDWENFMIKAFCLRSNKFIRMKQSFSPPPQTISTSTSHLIIKIQSYMIIDMRVLSPNQIFAKKIKLNYLLLVLDIIVCSFKKKNIF